jgi:hypothetical protein
MTLTMTPRPTTSVPPRSPGARRAWTIVGLILAIALIGISVPSLVGSVSSLALSARHRVFAGPVRAVTVRVDIGSVTIERATGSETAVDSTGVRGLTTPSDHEHLTGQTLVITSTCGETFFNNRCRRNYVVHVAPTVSVTVTSDEGDVETDGIDGPLDLHSGQGDVTVRGASGSVRATSSQGSVEAHDLRSPTVEAESDQGAVELGFAAPPRRATASADQGDVVISLPRGPASYQVHVGSDQGKVTNSVDTDPTSERVIRASSDQGDVTVAYGL